MTKLIKLKEIQSNEDNFWANYEKFKLNQIKTISYLIYEKFKQIKLKFNWKRDILPEFIWNS